MTGPITHYFPFIRTPLTDIGGHMLTHQSNDQCNDFEMKAVECLEAYGTIRGEELCKVYMDDLVECIRGDKAAARFYAMDKERKRQLKAGLITKEELYPIKGNIDGYGLGNN